MVDPSLYESDFISFMLALSRNNPINLFALFLLSLIRMAPIVSFVPFFGAKLPSSTKMGLAIALTFIFLPQIVMTNKTDLALNGYYLVCVIKELFVGVLLAFLAGVPFLMLQSSGTIIDFQRGSSSLQVTDPSMLTQTSAIGLFLNNMMILVFFETGGLYLYVDTLSHAYKVLPPAELLSRAFFESFHLPLWQTMLTLVSQFMAISIQLAAPSLLAILMTETFLGIANRLAPQVQITFLGMPLKSFLGIGVLFVGWFIILKQMSIQSNLWFEKVRSITPYLNP